MLAPGMKTLHRNSTEEVMERATGIEPATSSLGIKITTPFIFQNLQNCSRKINVQATHAVHAVPVLRTLRDVAGRFSTWDAAANRYRIHQSFDDVIQLVEISRSHETLPILPTNIFR